MLDALRLQLVVISQLEQARSVTQYEVTTRRHATRLEVCNKDKSAHIWTLWTTGKIHNLQQMVFQFYSLLVLNTRFDSLEKAMENDGMPFTAAGTRIDYLMRHDARDSITNLVQGIRRCWLKQSVSPWSGTHCRGDSLFARHRPSELPSMVNLWTQIAST